MGSPRQRFVWEVPLAFPAPHYSARESCPGHCGTLCYGTDLELIDVLPLENTGAWATMVELRDTPSKLVPFPEVVANITFFLHQRCVPRANRRPLRLSSSTSKKVCSSTVARVIAAHRARTVHSQFWYLRKGASRRKVKSCFLECRSFVGEHKLACKNDCVEVLSNDVPSRQAQTVE